MIFDSKAFFDTLFSTQFLWPAATTLGITLVSMMLAILLGFGGALAALSRVALLRWLVQLYLGFFRGVPVLVQIVFWYNAVPVLTNDAINLPALIAGTTQAKALERVNQKICKPRQKIALIYFPSFNDAVIQLRKKSADIAFVDWAFAAYVTHLMPELALASPIISGRPEVPRNQLGLAFRKNDKPLVTAVSAAITHIEKTGEYGKILDKWHLQNGDIRKPA